MHHILSNNLPLFKTRHTRLSLKQAFQRKAGTDILLAQKCCLSGFKKVLVLYLP